MPDLREIADEEKKASRIVQGTRILRKKQDMVTIYTPQGRALEYSLLALNHYRGCGHRCSYCYVPGCLHMKREAWNAMEAEPRPDIIEQLREDAPKYAGTDKRVLLSFTGDPYCPVEPELRLTRQAMEILKANKIPFQILTKGGTRAIDDFDLYGKNDAFATTMTLLDADKSREIEPGAATPDNRMFAILKAHSLKIETWVSLEPVLDAEQSLKIIDELALITTLFKIGTLNHMSSDTDWRKFGIKAIESCEDWGVDYYIKTDLAKHLKGVKYHNTDTRIVK